MIGALMSRLLAASQLPMPAARVAAYGAAVAGVPLDVIVRTVAVFTEGAIHGPDAARGMAAQLGG